MIENFTEEKTNTTMHRIYGQRATLSLNIESVIILASGRNRKDPHNMNKFAAESLGTVTSCLVGVMTN